MHANSSQKSNLGFTLIELMTVVAIIGLLSTVILSSLLTSRQKANDAKSKMQAKSIVNALYLARDPVTGIWPGTADGVWYCLKPSGSCWIGGASSVNADVNAKLVPLYFTAIPTPPNPPFTSTTYLSGSYVYTRYNSGMGSSPAGAYLIWGQSTPISTGACAGYAPAAALGDGMYYCYQYLGR